MECASALLAVMPKLVALKEIKLNNNKIGDEGGQLLARGLRTNQVIQVFHASNNKFSMLTATEFVPVISQTKALKDLDLSNNLIIMEELQLLANAFKESTLECLNLRGNLISAEEITAFDSILVTVTSMAKRKFLF